MLYDKGILPKQDAFSYIRASSNLPGEGISNQVLAPGSPGQGGVVSTFGSNRGGGS